MILVLVYFFLFFSNILFFTSTCFTRFPPFLSYKQKFNIQVSNPCCVLDQETSKKFLKGDEKDKYDFFARATLIKKMEDDFATAERIKNVTKKRLENVKLNLDLLNIDKLKAEAEVKSLSGVDNIDKELREAEGKMFWVRVRDKEQELAILNESLASPDEMTDLESKITNKKTLLS